MTQIAPVTLHRRPKAFDRSQAMNAFEALHPEFVQKAKNLPKLQPLSVHENQPQDYFQTQLTRVLFERMQGLPIVNTRLVVEVLPFQKLVAKDVTDAKHPKEIYLWLGIAITPWSVQAVIVAADCESVFEAKAGAKLDIELEGGVFTFIVTDDTLLGKCAMCSLKSPVFEFSDQATVRAFGLACASLLTGEEALVEEPEIENPKLSVPSPAKKQTQHEQGDEKVSRRAFLTKLTS